MRAITLASVVMIGPDVVFRELDGEMVLLNLETGTYFGLDAVGARVWTLIQDHGSLEWIFSQLRAEYRVDASILEHDLLELVEHMCAKGLVCVAAAAT